MILSTNHDQSIGLISLHPNAKLLVLILTIILVLMKPGQISWILPLFTWIGFLVILLLMAKPKVKLILRPFLLGISISVFMIITQGFLYGDPSSKAVAEISIYGHIIGVITIPGILAGINSSLRLLSIMTSSILFVSTTSVDELSTALLNIKIPYYLTFILLSGMRFLPLVQRNWSDLTDAYKLRGLDQGSTSKLSRIIYLYPKILASLILILFKQGINLEISIRTRGFGVDKKRTNYFEHKPITGDYLFSVVVITLFLVLVIIYW